MDPILIEFNEMTKEEREAFLIKLNEMTEEERRAFLIKLAGMTEEERAALSIEGVKIRIGKREMPTVKEYFDEKLKTYTIRRKSDTFINNCINQFQRYVYLAIGNKRLIDLQTTDIQNIYNQLCLESSNDKKLSGEVILNIYKCLLKVLGDAIRLDDLLQKNPAGNVVLQVCCDNCHYWMTCMHPPAEEYYEPMCSLWLLEKDTICPENPLECRQFVAMNDWDTLDRLREEMLEELMLEELS